jgi:hypothetical protein
MRFETVAVESFLVLPVALPQTVLGRCVFDRIHRPIHFPLADFLKQDGQSF